MDSDRIQGGAGKASPGALRSSAPGAGDRRTETAAQLPFSAKFLAQYRIEATLGSGAMGVVYRALQIDLERQVAIKVPTLTDPRQLERFVREGRILSKLNHPNLVRVYDADQDNGNPYIVFEFVRGRTLTAVARAGRLEAGHAATLVLQLLDGLAHAHSHGVLHRDVKSDNALVTADGTVKLADFGLARSDVESSGTLEGTITGTPAYMAPEQAQGLPVDARADLYSIGIILFELLTGRLPFESADLGELLRRQIGDAPPPVASLRPDLPSALDAVVVRALEKSKAERYPTAEEFAKALRQATTARSLRAGHGSIVEVVLSAGGEVVAGATVDPSPGTTVQLHHEGSTPGPRQTATRVRSGTTGPISRTARIRAWLEDTTARVGHGLGGPRIAGAITLALLGVLTVAGILRLVKGHPQPTSPAPTIVQGASGFLARWETEVAGPTEVEVVEPATKAPGRRYVNEAQRSVTRHSITVTQLAAGTEYLVRSVLHDGTLSAPTRAIPAPVARLVSQDPHVHLAGGTLEVSVTTSLPARARARIVRDGQETEMPPTEDYTTRHSIRVERVGPDEELGRVELSLEGIDLKEQVVLGPLYGPRRLVRELGSALALIKDEDYEAVAKTIFKQLDAARRAALRAGPGQHHTTPGIAHGRQTLIDWLKSKALYGRIEALRWTGPGVLASETVSLDEKIRLYENLGRLDSVDAVGYAYTSSSVIDVPALYSSLVSVTYPEVLGSGRPVADFTPTGVVHFMSRRYRKEAPTARSPDGKYCRVADPLESVGEKVSADYHCDARAQVTLEPAGVPGRVPGRRHRRRSAPSFGPRVSCLF